MGYKGKYVEVEFVDSYTLISQWNLKRLAEIVNSKLRVPDLMCRRGDPTRPPGDSKWRYAKGNHSVGRVPPSWYCFVLEKRSLDGRCILDTEDAVSRSGLWRYTLGYSTTGGWLLWVLGCVTWGTCHEMFFFNVKLFNRKRWTWEIKKKEKQPWKPKNLLQDMILRFCVWIPYFRLSPSWGCDDASSGVSYSFRWAQRNSSSKLFAFRMILKPGLRWLP